MGLFFGSLVVLAAVWQAPTTIDRIVAVVNGDIITLSDVRAARVLKLVPDDAGEKGTVAALVERRLVLSEMRRFQTPEPSPDAVSIRRSEWERLVNDATPEALLALAGVDAAFLQRWLADDLRRENYLRQRFAALEGARRDEAIRLWIAGLHTRAEIVYRDQRF
jgi:hypothetical protein